MPKPSEAPSLNEASMSAASEEPADVQELLAQQQEQDPEAYEKLLDGLFSKVESGEVSSGEKQSGQTGGAYAAIKRDYPGITDERIDELLRGSGF